MAMVYKTVPKNDNKTLAFPTANSSDHKGDYKHLETSNSI